MKKFIDRLWSHLRSGLGQPTLIERWTTQVAPSQKQTASLTSDSIQVADVVRWDKFGEDHTAPGLSATKGVLRGWVAGPGGTYESGQLACEALRHLMVETTTAHWQCDLKDVQGLSSSKSDLGQFASMNAFATQACAGLLEPATSEALDKNLHWHEVRIHDPNGPDHFCRYDWDGRLFLNNSGGSHHFAAAHQMATERGQDVPLTGRLKTYSLNLQAVSALRDQFEVFALPKDPVLKNAFWYQMKALGASHYTLPLPGAAGQTTDAVLLPRNEPAAMKVAAVLRREKFWDLGQTLQDLATGAHRHNLSSLPRTAPAPLPTLAPTLSTACHRLEAPRPASPIATPDLARPTPARPQLRSP